MNSTVVLGSKPDSTISYNVWLYNNSDKDHVFIGITKDEKLYSNANITYSTDLVPYETIIKAGQNMDFTITFSYAGSDVSNNTLNSLLNFRFLEIPKLEVSSAGDIAGIYPGQTKEASFTVTNFDSNGINGVPLDYTLAATIYNEKGVEVTGPITATICDTNGTAVTKAISMPGGEGVTKTTHTYKLKLAWNASNNSAEYANKTYTYKIKAVAIPNATATEGKYAGYTLNKEAPAKEPLAKITTAPFYFVTDPTSAETTSIEMADNKAAINLTVSNNDGKNYNAFETKYTISLDNTDFMLYVTGIEYANNRTGEIQLGAGALINSVEAIELKPKTTSTTLTSTETCNLTITTTSPYAKTVTLKITATDKTAPTAPEITGGSEAYATSRTIRVSKEATDVGTGVKYYQYIVDSDGQAIATTETGNVGSTTNEISKTFDTDYAGYYVYFRAVDAVGNAGAWSDAERLFIDTQPPTIEPKEETVEITENDNNSLETYFNISKNGNAEITKKEFIDTCHSNTVITDTNQLAVGTHTIQATVEKSTGATATAMLTIIVAALGFTLTFIANGSEFATITEAQTVRFPEENPTLEGKAFTGWYYDEATTQQVNVGDSVTQNISLYAGWKSYVLNPNNGKTKILIHWAYPSQVLTKSGSFLEEDLETIYVYEGSSEIEYLELDKDSTRADFYEAGGLVMDRDWVNEPPEKAYDLEDKDMFQLFYTENNKLKLHVGQFCNMLTAGNVINGLVGVKIHFVDGSVENDLIDFLLIDRCWCLVEGSKISLSDKTTKSIENIDYDDRLLVWDFDNARFATAKPLWLMKQQVAGKYNLLKFDNGSELKTIDQHRIFNKEAGKFTYPMTDETPIGTTTFTHDGTETKLISKEVVRETVNYYNIITDYHMNLFANGILTSCRLSNLYNIENMKYIKDNRELTPREAFPTVPDEYYYGLRLAEQPKEVNRGNDVKHSEDLEGYVQNLINKAKPKK